MPANDQVAKILGSNNVTLASVTSRGTKGAVGVEILDAQGNQITLGSGLVTSAFDYISLSNYDASGNVGTVVYRNGGVIGTIVATLTLTYDASGNLTSISKS